MTKIIGVPSLVRAGLDLTLFVDRGVEVPQSDSWQLAEDELVVEEAIKGSFGREWPRSIEFARQIGFVSLEARTADNTYWLSSWLAESWRGHGIEPVALHATIGHLIDVGGKFNSKTYEIFADYGDESAQKVAEDLGVRARERPEADTPYLKFTFARSDLLRSQLQSEAV